MKLGTKENPRHVAGISGGKDSAANTILIKNTRPDIFEKLELFFTDTGSELPEVYDYLEKMEKYLGKPILRIKADPNSNPKYKVVTGEDTSTPFDDYLTHYKGYLPAPNARWCTRVLKIKTMEEWLGDDYVISYIGIRADEPSREGYNSRSEKSNIEAVYPFREDKLGIQDIYRILDEAGVGLPEYYKWRTRSGCYFCFYQRRVEWAILAIIYPYWFEEAKKYETTHADGRMYSWVKDKPLDYIAKNATDIIIRYIKKQYKKVQAKWLLTYSLDQMIEMVTEGKLKEFLDSWDLKKLHDVDGENKEGCAVCAI